MPEPLIQPVLAGSTRCTYRSDPDDPRTRCMRAIHADDSDHDCPWSMPRPTFPPNRVIREGNEGGRVNYFEVAAVAIVWIQIIFWAGVFLMKH